MLKMLKHDIKNSYLEVLILNGLIIALAFLGFLASKLQTTFYMIIVISSWGITIAIAFIAVLKSIVDSFHKCLFTDYGYLTLTTPVSVDKILLSKIIVNMLWIIVTFVAVIAGLLIFIYSLVDAVTVRFFYDILFESIKKHPLEFFKGTVSALFSALNFITMLIFVLVLVNTGGLRKHKLFKGALIYIVITTLISAINPFQSFASIKTYAGKTADYFIGLIISALSSAAFYFVSRYLIINKLEIE